MEQPGRILVVRLSAMGDVIHTLPAVAALRQAFPAASIDWLVEERWSELLCAQGIALGGSRSEQKPLVDRVVTVRTKAWRKRLIAPATWADIGQSFRQLRAVPYDVAIDFQGAIRSGLMAQWSGARRVTGFAEPRERPARMFYNETAAVRGGHVIEQNFALAEAATGPLPRTGAVFPRDRAAEHWCDRYCDEHVAGKLVLINPGSGWGAKQWPGERYGAVARELSSDGHTVLVNHGPGEEELASLVQQSSGGGALPVQCSVGQLIALTRRAALFVGGDTGPLHLAAALQIPVAAIFGPTDPERNGPFGTRSEVLRSPESVTSYSHVPAVDPGLLRISADMVVAASRRLLAGGTS